MRFDKKFPVGMAELPLLFYVMSVRPTVYDEPSTGIIATALTDTQ